MNLLKTTDIQLVFINQVINKKKIENLIIFTLKKGKINDSLNLEIVAKSLVEIIYNQIMKVEN